MRPGGGERSVEGPSQGAGGKSESKQSPRRGCREAAWDKRDQPAWDEGPPACPGSLLLRAVLLCGLGQLPMVCERPAGSAWTGGHSWGKCSGPGLGWLRAEEQVPAPLCHHLGDIGRTLRPRRPSPHLAFVPVGL